MIAHNHEEYIFNDINGLNNSQIFHQHPETEQNGKTSQQNHTRPPDPRHP